MSPKKHQAHDTEGNPEESPLKTDTTLMEVYLGRQPILDRGGHIAGYELLFRSSLVNYCDATDDVAATSQVIVNAVLGVGLDQLLGGKPAFINFDRTLLLGDWTTLLPPDKAVIEILESVPPDQEVLAACHKLQQQGYALALDDCLDDGRTALFAPFVDILKVDFRQTSPADQARMVRLYQKLNLRMLAEKVETEEEFQRALQLGFEYFQGFFFARPAVLQAARVPASHISGLRLMKQMQREEPDLAALEDLIRHDVSFSYSLLKYLNSAVFHHNNPVASVRQGLLLMGTDEIRKWVWMASLSSLARNSPPALMEQVLMRGRFCEAIAGLAKLRLGDSDPFLLGMFSLLGAILRRPLEGILGDLNIDRNLRDALLGATVESDPLSLVLRLVKSHECGDWCEVDAAARILGLTPETLTGCYLRCLSWVDAVFAPEQHASPADCVPAPVVFHRQKQPHGATRH